MNRIPRRNLVIFVLLTLFGTGFDLTTKSVIFRRVGPPGSEPVSVIPNILELRTAHNTGALWGMGKDIPHSSLIFAALSIVAVILIVWWLFWQGAAKDFWLTLALALIMAGASGNCYDRLRFGYVRDFVYFHIDPIGFECAIFNFADNMLVAGAVILMLLALKPMPAIEDRNEILSAPQPNEGR
jgi:signal peptidase II